MMTPTIGMRRSGAWIHCRYIYSSHLVSRCLQPKQTTLSSTTGKNLSLFTNYQFKESRSSAFGLIGVPKISHMCRFITNLNEHKESEEDNELSSNSHSFHPGDAIQVEVTSFGPLGASAVVVGLSHDGDLLPADQEPYGSGLILQKEIAYFRQARDNVDVVRGEILNAYIQNVREEDGKLDISLRRYGGKAKSEEVADIILKRLEWTPGGILNLGERSSPKDIANEFPGVSKSVFKKALGGLYKKSLVKPGPNSIELIKK